MTDRMKQATDRQAAAKPAPLQSQPANAPEEPGTRGEAPALAPPSMRARPNPDGPPLLRRLASPQHQQALLELQRANGNAAVQRLLKQTRQAAGVVQRQPFVLQNMPEGLAFAQRIEDLFDLYAARNPLHHLPGTLFAYARTWIQDSAGSGRIREEVRRRLRTMLDPSVGFPPWVQAVAILTRLRASIDAINGPAARKRELEHIITDVFEIPTWRATDQITINLRWPAWRSFHGNQDRARTARSAHRQRRCRNP